MIASEDVKAADRDSGDAPDVYLQFLKCSWGTLRSPGSLSGDRRGSHCFHHSIETSLSPSHKAAMEFQQASR